MKLCTINGCARRLLARGWCSTHWARWRRHGDPEWEPPSKPTRCSVEGCDRHPNRSTVGLCEVHYMRKRRTGDPLGRQRRFEECVVEGCKSEERDRPRQEDGLCRMHVARMKRRGDPSYEFAGQAHPWWLDDKTIGYPGVHIRLQRERGRADEQDCVICGGRAAQWAYDHMAPDERRSPDGLPFSPDLTHYKPMCVSCHIDFDHGRVTLGVSHG